MKNLKFVSIILLSLLLVFTFTTFAFAADEGTDTNTGLFSVENETTDNETDDNVWDEPNVMSNTAETEENETIVNEAETEDENESLYSINNSASYDDENNSTTNSNSLAYTGIGDSNGMIALIVIVSGIVAIYSAKKFNDYKNV